MKGKILLSEIPSEIINKTRSNSITSEPLIGLKLKSVSTDKNAYPPNHGLSFKDPEPFINEIVHAEPEEQTGPPSFQDQEDSFNTFG